MQPAVHSGDTTAAQPIPQLLQQGSVEVVPSQASRLPIVMPEAVGVVLVGGGPQAPLALPHSPSHELQAEAPKVCINRREYSSCKEAANVLVHTVIDYQCDVLIHCIQMTHIMLVAGPG